MARPSKLSIAQCAQFRTMRTDPKLRKRYTMAQLCKKFGISESSGYKVMDGSYVAHPDEPQRARTPHVRPLEQPAGVTPSLFHPERRSASPALHLVQSRGADMDHIMQLAEQLVAAKSAFVQALRAA